jgi:hypothetical protein
VVLPAALVLTGCGTAPLSVLTNDYRTATDTTLYPLRIVAVDGAFNTQRAVQVYPGARLLLLESPPPTGQRTAAQQAVILRVAPCTTYRLAARRSSGVQRDWSLVVDAAEPVAGCDVEDELRKSRQAGKAVGLPAAASAPAR